MIQSAFNSYIYLPLYNALATLVSIMPGADFGLAIIALTIVVRLLLFPLFLKASRTQHLMRQIEPERALIQEKFKNDREALGRETLALFKKHGVNPFSTILPILVQLPVIIGLYSVFYHEIGAAAVDPALLYSFVPIPKDVSFSLLGLIDLTERSLLLAFGVAVTQFFSAQLMPTPAPRTKPAGASFTEDLAHNMHLQMRYVFPVIFGIVSYYISAAVALYFFIANLFGILQEIVVQQLHRRHHGNRTPLEPHP